MNDILAVQSELDRVRLELEQAKSTISEYQTRDTERPPSSLRVELISSLISEVQGMRLDVQRSLEAVERHTDAVIAVGSRIEKAEARVLKLERWQEDRERSICAEINCPRRAVGV